MWLQLEQLSFVGSGFKSLLVLQCSGICWDQVSISGWLLTGHGMEVVIELGIHRPAF